MALYAFERILIAEFGKARDLQTGNQTSDNSDEVIMEFLEYCRKRGYLLRGIDE